MFGLGKRRNMQVTIEPVAELTGEARSAAIHALVHTYVAAMETEESAKWCKCEWIIHPDDAGLAENCCRVCGTTSGPPLHPTHFNMDGSHDYRGRRKMRGDQHPECPVHTREGLILYFFEWAGKRHE
jgi:hypothetical protein